MWLRIGTTIVKTAFNTENTKFFMTFTGLLTEIEEKWQKNFQSIGKRIDHQILRYRGISPSERRM
jgi:hypothetical protein